MESWLFRVAKDTYDFYRIWPPYQSVLATPAILVYLILAVPISLVFDMFYSSYKFFESLD